MADPYSPDNLMRQRVIYRRLAELYGEVARHSEELARLLGEDDFYFKEAAVEHFRLADKSRALAARMDEILGDTAAMN